MLDWKKSKTNSGHHVTISHYTSDWFGILEGHQIRDAVDFFYEGDNAIFDFIMKDNTPGRRGSCNTKIFGHHIITLSLPTIKEHLKNNIRMGGNKKHDNLNEAVMSVLTHEIQHANQTRTHGQSAKFWKGNYLARPCEVDARRFADSQLDNILCMLGKDFSSILKNHSKNEELENIIEVFSFSDEITSEDIIHELKTCGMYNPLNLNYITESLVKINKKIP